MWVLLWLSPHEKREFGGRTATAARGRDPDIDGERALRRTCDASIPPSHQRHNRRDVPISHPTSLCFETEPTDPTARRLSVPPNGRDAAAARALEERKSLHVGCRVDRHGVLVVLQVPEVQRSWVRANFGAKVVSTGPHRREQRISAGRSSRPLQKRPVGGV